jgi:hypothetical protein
MKNIFVIILSICIWKVSIGQELSIIRDTINHFEIGVPAGWKYGVPANKSVTFMALSQKTINEASPRENFNINILHGEETNLNKSFSDFLSSLGNAEGFKIIDQGEKIIKERKYKYLIETHKNKISKEDMNNYVLFTNDNGTVLILTMVTTSKRFEQFKGLFDAIANSLAY